MKNYSIRHEKNNPKPEMLGDGKVALGITLGAIGVVIVGLLVERVNSSGDQSYFFDFTPIIVSLLVAMTSTFLAARVLLEQRKTREAGTDPVLVVHLGQREDARELITLNISNVGAGAALNVALEVERPSDDMVGRDLLTDVFRKHHPFTVILQGKSIEFSLAVGWELLGSKLLPPFRAKLAYEDLAGGKYESEFMLDMREMEGLGANKSPIMRVVSALEKMAK